MLWNWISRNNEVLNPLIREISKYNDPIEAKQRLCMYKLKFQLKNFNKNSLVMITPNYKNDLMYTDNFNENLAANLMATINNTLEYRRIVNYKYNSARKTCFNIMLLSSILSLIPISNITHSFAIGSLFASSFLYSNLIVHFSVLSVI